ncbi:11544_t:CDS:2 [Acaulospora morrowiae]|uniref:11544_t:CDS:1 n=1 Tax=Acaulospora morrowiae TaxID=94023 RepID=A0A9N8YMP4_9GLOM|nr:11544_t:CDS:2 [Acaulospora morrowiae]
MKFRIYPKFSTTNYVYRPNPLTFTIWILADEDYRHPQRLSVQLWSNLTFSSWSQTDLIELDDNQLIGNDSDEKYRVFEAIIPTDGVNQGQHEFCFRVKRIMETYEEDWQWIDVDGNRNGQVFVFDFKNAYKVGIDSIFGEEFINVGVRCSSHGNTSCWIVAKEAKADDEQSVSYNMGSIMNMIRFVGLQRHSAYWVLPTTGTCKLDICQKDVVYLIAQQSTGHYVVFIPLTAEDCTSCFRSDENGNLIYIVNNYSGKDELARFVVGRGYDPYATSKACMDLAKTVYGRIRSHKKNIHTKNDHPLYYEKLGYCTWNAFHENVRRQDLVDVLHSLDSSGIHVGYMIMEDGWQQVSHNRQLQNFEANEKFPDGLREFVQYVKGNYPYLNYFGVWHTLCGYWNGIDPNSELAKQYCLEKVRGEGRTMNLVSPEYVTHFYDDFYRFLKTQGVELVKVDSHASFDLIELDEIERCRWRKKYQGSQNKCAERYFDNRVIYSMAHSPNVMQPIISNDGLPTEVGVCKPVFRNSDDYCSSKHGSHALHLYVNSMNNIWTSFFGVPDWDAFQTNHEFAEYHAAARAISGGPVYISDPPRQHNMAILEKCIVKTPAYEIRSVTTDHAENLPGEFTKVFTQRILRSETPALPSIGNIFEDPTTVDKLLKISNVNQRIGVLGLWNCREKEVVDKFDLEDVYGIAVDTDDAKARVNEEMHRDPRFRNSEKINCITEDVEYALYFFKNREVKKIGSMGSKKQVAIMVKPRGFEVVTISPIDVLLVIAPFEYEIRVEIACFGLVDKYNGSKAIVVAEYISEGWDVGGSDYAVDFRVPNNHKASIRASKGVMRSGNRRGMVFYKVKLTGYGSCGFYLNVGEHRRVSNIKVYLNNKILSDELIEYDVEKKFLVIGVHENEKVTSEELENKRRNMWNADYGDDVLEMFLEIMVD